ncbi:hypothetical protein KXV92_007044 [Aspergillus fumigatus]|nr:hypothetical protein KXW88_002778 [Aspergillus fumigatus]KAH2362434.1 hypothetical protein KXV98_005366 [Aspergillus fumigatus]KAH3183146.1 hypothetical protein KXV92_007044 [Aspergillus fumigatus]KAJ8227126.1 hypothetical protein LV156_008759 [Aspergillus fumigatus]KAJ8228617.1 hypothetical protein LV160_008760 [Aspergillus fumigatus]
MSLQKLPDELLLLVISHLDPCSLYCLSHSQRKLRASIRGYAIARPTDVFFNALEFNYVAIIKFVVRNEHIIISDLEDALWAAAEHNRKDALDVLLQFARDDIARKRWRTLQLPYDMAKTKEVRELLIHHNPEAALPHMVYGGHIEEVRKLLERKRQIPLAAKADMLEFATCSGNTDMVKLLRQFGYCSQRAYIHAFRKNDLSLADLLNGDPNAMVDGQRPLHEAVRASSVKGIEYLLGKGANQTLRNGKQQSPLDIAMYEKNELIIRALNRGRHSYAMRNRTHDAREGKRRKIGSRI